MNKVGKSKKEVFGEPQVDFSFLPEKPSYEHGGKFKNLSRYSVCVLGGMGVIVELFPFHLSSVP